MPPYAYIAALWDDALTILDVANPAAPAFVGSIQGGWGVPPWLAGIQKVFVRGNYAYCACWNDDSLTIIDISNPAAPAFVSSIRGWGIPNWLGGAYDVHVVGNYAYVTAYTDDNLTIIDISNPAVPAFVGTVNDGWPLQRLGWASKVIVIGNYAYVTAQAGDAFTIVDISNPAVPFILSSLQGAGFPNWLGSAVSFRISGNYAYVVARADSALTIIDISNPAVPVVVGSIQGALPPGPPWLGRPYDVFVEGNYAYVADQWHNALTIIDISNPAVPVFAGSIQSAWPFGVPPWLFSATGVTKKGIYAYVAAQADNALSIIDVSNPVAPIFVGAINGPGFPTWLQGANWVFLLGIIPPIVSTNPATGVT